jgi:fructoselysine-6-P-deglycase FrlB-like protein
MNLNLSRSDNCLDDSSQWLTRTDCLADVILGLTCRQGAPLVPYASYGSRLPLGLEAFLATYSLTSFE